MHRREFSTLLEKRISEDRRFIQVVVGPRQVGKTFGVKQALQSAAQPYTYRTAESFAMQGVVALESLWLDARLAARSNGGHLLVIDEIQKINGWSDSVKRLWDEDTFSETPLKVVLLGSSRLLLQKGLSESLNGRFELIEAGHWLYSEMRDAFGFSIDDFILYGAYPGAAELRGDDDRWLAYIRDSIAEPSISTDIFQMESITKPALLRQVFRLGCLYSARILSYQKMVGQLQDAGNVSTVAHYLQLLSQAGLLTGLEKYYVEGLRQKASSPKLSVCNNALMTAYAGFRPTEWRTRPDLWGHLVESAVGAYLMSSARQSNVSCYYWNAGAQEVDYVLRRGDELLAIEVKSGQLSDVSGMKSFCRQFPTARPCLVGNPGLPLSTLFTTPVSDLFPRR